MQPAHGVQDPCPSNPEFKERVKLYVCSSFVLSWQVIRWYLLCVNWSIWSMGI